MRKIVRYSKTNLRGLYNLGFGDKDDETGFISDTVITNNHDSQKVLATVAATLYAFIETHPGAEVIAMGSTEVRTRLYRIGISKNLEDIELDFEIFGLKNEMWETFRKNVRYTAYLVCKKP